jgi:hypothetical protein
MGGDEWYTCVLLFSTHRRHVFPEFPQFRNGACLLVCYVQKRRCVFCDRSSQICVKLVAHQFPLFVFKNRHQILVVQVL